MRIGIDISQAAFEGSGVGRYTTLLVESLLEYDTKNDYVFFYSSLRKSVPEKLRKLIKSPHELKTFRMPPTFLNLMWNELHILPIERFIGNVDIFVSSDWAQPPVSLAKSVTIVHDLVMYVHPETLTSTTTVNVSKAQIKANIVDTHKKRLGWVKKDVDRIIADSLSTKKDIERYLEIPSDKIDVIYPAVEAQSDAKSVLKKYNLERPYILSVGKLEPRKNIQRLIEAFVLSHAFKTTDLVIVGADGWGDATFNIPEETRSHVKFLGYVSENDLFGLYKDALFFCYPSIYEGFGYPIIEAMRMGTPVVTSNVSSMKELAEGYGELFDPHDTQDLVRALSTLLEDSGKRNRLVKKAQPYAETFTRKKFAQELMKVFASLK